MISILLSWLICGFVFLVFGRLFTDICSFFYKKSSCGFVGTFFLGLCFIGTIISILSIWMPINSHIAWFSLIISILYTVYLYTVKRDRVLQKVVLCLHSQPLSAKLLILLVFAIVLYYSLLPPLVADARLYYLQSILWNETYPLIPGLGNIHGRLGFNSNILLLTSAFSFYDIFSFRVFAIVGLSVFVLIGWMITELVRQKDMVKAIITGIVCFAFLYEYGLGISSASTDIMPNVIVMFLLMKIIFDKDSLSQSPVMFWTLSLYALTLKLSIAPLCLLCVLILYTLARKKQYSQIVVLSVIAVFVIIPWCIRTTVITGYLIYPYPSLDIFNFDWKIPKALVEEEKIWVTSWAKMPGMDYHDFLNMSYTEWLKVWLVKYIRYGKLYFLLFCLAGVSPLIVWFIRKKQKNMPAVLIYSWLTAFVGFVFWFILAPDPRFGFSFVLIASFAPFFMVDFKIKTKDSVAKRLPIAIFVILLFFVIFKGYDLHKAYRADKTLMSYLYSPQSMDSLNKEANTGFKTHSVDSMIIYTPDDSMCSDHPIPCTPDYLLNNNLEMRGKYIQDGFRIKQQ